MKKVKRKLVVFFFFLKVILLVPAIRLWPRRDCTFYNMVDHIDHAVLILPIDIDFIDFAVIKVKDLNMNSLEKGAPPYTYLRHFARSHTDLEASTGILSFLSD